MKKEIVILFLFAVMLCLPNASACDSDQRIMRISADTNAHGEVYNGGSGYTTEICYDDIFETTYSGSPIHSCNGLNKVLGLSSSTNAHAEIPSLSNYGTKVCYGDLECQTTTGSCDEFVGNYECMVTLSGDTNAHLATCGGSSPYSTKICCKSLSGYVFTLFGFWSGLSDGSNQITSVDKDEIVYLVAEMGSFLEGQVDVNFTIYDEDDNLVNSTVVTIFDTDKAILAWKAGEQGVYDYLEYYFKVQIYARESQSEDLTVFGDAQEVYWADENKNKITSRDLVPEETTVLMIFKNADLTHDIGEPVNFSIYEDELLIDSEVRTGEDAIVGYVDSDSDAVASWTLSYSDLEKFDLENPNEFIFTVDNLESEDLISTIAEPAACVNVLLCSDYTSESICESDSCGVADASIGNNGGIACGEGGVVCGCEWSGSSCSPSYGVYKIVCGDGITESGEECDDGNTADNDGCSSGCEFEVLSPPCPVGTKLCSDSTCSIDCTATDGGATCNNNGVCEGDEGCFCFDCDEETDTCASGLTCSFEDRACCNGESDEICNPYCADIDPDCGGPIERILMGKCNFSESGSDDCADSFLTYSWIATIDWSVENPGEATNPDGEDYVQFLSSLDPENPGFDDLWHYDPIDTSSNKRPLFEGCRSGAKTIPCPAQIQLAFFDLCRFIIAVLLIGLIYGVRARRKK